MKITSSLLLSVTLLALGASNAGAATIFSESMGTVSATTAISAHESVGGFDNDAFTFSGTGDVRSTSPSSGYIGASGSANVYLAPNATKTFEIEDISTVGYTVGSIGITFGASKNTTASDMTTLNLEYSTDGSSWAPLSIPAQPTGTGTSGWRLVSLSSTSIPISATLSLRWTNADTGTTQYRVDDIALTGTAVPETSAALLGALGVLGMLRRRR